MNDIERKAQAIADLAKEHGFKYEVENAAGIDGTVCIDMAPNEYGEYAIVVIHEDGSHSVPFGSGSIVDVIKSLGNAQPD